MDCICRKCGEHHDVEFPQSVNASESPQLKAAVRDGSLFLWECPYCGTRNLVTGQFLYHDPSARLMVWLLPGNQEPPSSVNQALSGLDGYSLRLVRETGDLIEKVNIAEASLDDLTVEVCKWVTRQELQAKNPEMASAALRFLRTEGADNDLVFAFPHGGNMNLVNVGFNVYEDAAGILSRNPSLSPGSGFASIDAAWVSRHFR